jgi:hypothetical protein
MSTEPSPVVTQAPVVHQSWWSRAATWFGHEAKTIKNVILKIVGAAPAISAEIAKIAPTLEAVSNMIVPGSATWEQHLVDVWAVSAKAVSDAGAAATANGVSVTLDQTLVDDIKGFLPAVQKYLHPTASTAPAPAPPVAVGPVVAKP